MKILMILFCVMVIASCSLASGEKQRQNRQDNAKEYTKAELVDTEENADLSPELQEDNQHSEENTPDP